MEARHNKWGERTGMTPEEFAELRARSRRDEPDKNVASNEQRKPGWPHQVVCSMNPSVDLTKDGRRIIHVSGTTVTPPSRPVEHMTTALAKEKAKVGLVFLAMAAGVGVFALLVGIGYEALYGAGDTPWYVSVLGVIAGLLAFCGLGAFWEAIVALTGDNLDGYRVTSYYCPKCHEALSLRVIPSEGTFHCPGCGAIIRAEVPI